MSRERLVITGANGQLGRALRAQWPDAVAVDLDELDVADAAALAAFDWRGVGTLVNAAAYTDVDGAETPAGRGAAWRVNATAVASLAHLAQERGITLVHVSSDYVFDGTRAPYAEDAPLAPLGAYGASKAAGDIAAAFAPCHYLLRTSWVIGEGRNFVRTMLGLARRGVQPRVVCDQVGRPTFTGELARAVAHLLSARPPFGTYNVTNGGPAVSWAELTREIYALAGLPNTVAEITAAEWAAARAGVAPRPPDSRLDLGRIAGTGFEPRDWRAALADYLRREREAAP